MKQKKLLSLLLALAMTLSLAVPALAAGDQYAGIESGQWYEAAAKHAVDNGVMTGTDQGFMPASTVTRAEIYQIIYNMEGKPAGDAAGFTDTAGQWYAAAADWAAKAGMLTVPESKLFAGGDVITRAEVAQVIANYAKLKGITVDTAGMAMKEAPDYAAIPAQYLPGMTFCYYGKVMVGDAKGNLNPGGQLTRAELAQIMMNYAALTPAPVGYTTENVTIDVPEQDGIPAHAIPAVVTLPEGEGKYPAVVMLHGTGSNKDEAGNGYVMAASALAASGIASIRFDFMGNGESKADYVNYNYTSAKIDAKAAADYLAELSQVDASKLGVMGWSQGGTDALLAAAAYPDTFQAVVTWAGALDLTTMFKDFKAAKAEAEKNGYFEMTFDWREPLHFGAQWFKEVADTDLLKITAQIKAPILAINGDKDDVVPLDNAVSIKKAAQDGMTWIVDGADHTYNVFSGDLAAINDAISNTAYFFQAKLNGALAGSVTAVSKYGNITTTIPQTACFMAGFEPGDILAAAVNGKTVSLPYGDNYSNVDTGKEILVPDKDTGCVALAINMGDFAKTYGVEVGTEIQLSMDKKAGYLEEYEIRSIDSKRTNERADYASDEVFANFRPVAMGTLAKDVLYRSSSPANNELGRAATADKLIEAAGVNTVMNLADSKEELEGYFTAEDFASPYYKSLYDAGKVVYLDMGVDFTAPEFAAGLKTGLEFIIANKGPYLVHCNEGKDRAGFTVALLEALMGGKLEEIKADYMLSFLNYYHVEKDSTQYNKLAESNIMENLRMIAGLKDGADLSKVDLQKAAEDYLTKTVGLTADQVAALKTALSTPIAAEKAA